MRATASWRGFSNPRHSLGSEWNYVIYQSLGDLGPIDAFTGNHRVAHNETVFQALIVPKDRFISELLLQIGHDFTRQRSAEIADSQPRGPRLKAVRSR